MEHFLNINYVQVISNLEIVEDNGHSTMKFRLAEDPFIAKLSKEKMDLVRKEHDRLQTEQNKTWENYYQYCFKVYRNHDISRNTINVKDIRRTLKYLGKNDFVLNENEIQKYANEKGRFDGKAFEKICNNNLLPTDIPNLLFKTHDIRYKNSLANYEVMALLKQCYNGGHVTAADSNNLTAGLHMIGSQHLFTEDHYVAALNSK
ncbi:uncharacterized protein LOC126901079 isoform X2 [Daktulosphaira vitifoliae]|uniref:uncharacterized protein LOC126901079 isoform X2 n=1 Tax=Daktulosphaira vitifoliae TaxID=58002 RepID=UPI0021A9D462|nr:uncharacterized protein LOC126901079 isoform X2 [Daktulosphaira vitifoliae]